ncbi:FAD-binding domain [Bradyrhizobium sp.]|uniref:FAD-binding domain n=1 Tax=Bradyrhizobium sp. TaxID=376 RepID=UPI002D6D92B0|nr:FAD-binding domain [Bradyrhizobium sp.]HZR76920.1 FAD-binding domain [Bradyrhizobium sp.]
MKTILISGMGIAGPTLAYWLKAAGFAPTLVETAPRLRSGGYIVDFWGLGYDIAERMGLLDQIDHVGYRVREMRIVDDRGARIAGFRTRTFTELTGGRFITLARSDLSRLLFHTIKDKTETIFGDEIVGLRQNAEHVEVRFRQAGERRFDLLIGADGLHSAVRRLAFGPGSRFEKKLGYAFAAFEIDGYQPRDEDVYVIYGRPGQMLGRFTQRANRTLFLFFFTTGEGALPVEPVQQKAMLRERYRGAKWELPAILTELDQTEELYFDSVSQIRMENWSRGRVALAGDAAFCVSLLAGQGSALAMISAYVLAGELMRAGGRHDEAFTRYEALLRPFVSAKQRGAERLGGMFAPRTRWGLQFRNYVIKAFAIPGLARLAVGRDIIDNLSLPAYDWPTS